MALVIGLTALTQFVLTYLVIFFYSLGLYAAGRGSNVCRCSQGTQK